MTSAQAEPNVRVSTTVLADGLDLTALLRVMLMLGLIWFIYAGYAWLTNAVAGVKKAIGYVWDPVPWPQALAIGGGIAVFLLGDVAFRRLVAIGAGRYRSLGAVLALATVPLGLWPVAAQLGALVLVLIAMLVVEFRPTRPVAAASPAPG